MPNTRWLTCCGCLILVLGLLLPAAGNAVEPGKLRVQTQTVSPQSNVTTAKPKIAPISLPRGHNRVTSVRTKDTCFADCGDGTGFICSGPNVACGDGLGCAVGGSGVVGIGNCSDHSISFFLSD